LGLHILPRQGKYTQFGLFGKKIEVNIDLIAYKEIKTTGVYAHRWPAWRKAIQYLGSGTVKTRSLVTDVLPLTEWKKGSRSSRRRRA
jgi:L-iditol 2-dehydrogenase